MLTSVDRDDLPDGGARHYADCIRAIKARCPQTAVEALTPDFAGNFADVATVVDSGARRVRAESRDRRAADAHECATRAPATRKRSRVLAFAKQHRADVLTKSSLMLGLGETEDEIAAALDDLKAADVDIVTFGQYLRPTPNHLAVERYVTPQEFDLYRAVGPRARLPRGRRGPARAVELSRRPRVREEQRGALGAVSEFLAAYGLFLAQLATFVLCSSSSSSCSSRRRAAAAMPRASSSSI